MGNSIFQITGGIGKHIAATAVIKNYRKSFPLEKIIVVAAWPEVFTNNSSCDRLYKIGFTPNFYQDYINKSSKIFSQDPYLSQDHILKTSHLIETWTNMTGAKFEYLQMPVLKITATEEDLALSKLPKTNKPILLFQPFGGVENATGLNYSWSRDIHPRLAQGLVDVLSEKYTVVHVCYKHHPILNNCFRFDEIVNKKALFAMLKFSQEALLIDSSLQHAAAAFDIPSTVLWNVTSPDIFGYNLHTNFTPKHQYLEGTVDSYLYDYGFNGVVHECPYSTDELSKLWDFDEIVTPLMNQ